MNAAQASPSGGVVTVKTRCLDTTVEIAVIDRGSGIEAKNRESIFNPFFTTKSAGVGLGPRHRFENRRRARRPDHGRKHARRRQRVSSVFCR